MSQNYIEYGYDRSARSWCILVLDEKGNQVASSYVGNKDGVKYEIKRLTQEYKVEKIVKIMAY